MNSQSYDTIAEHYRDSKLLSFREFIERYTVMESLGDLHAQTVLDMACGERVYARQFRQAGAAGVTGVDISSAMVSLAEAQERAKPIGCRYVCADATEFKPAEPVDVVTAIYLFNYARTSGGLRRFIRGCFRALRLAVCSSASTTIFDGHPGRTTYPSPSTGWNGHVRGICPSRVMPFGIE